MQIYKLSVIHKKSLQNPLSLPNLEINRLRYVSSYLIMMIKQSGQEMTKSGQDNFVKLRKKKEFLIIFQQLERKEKKY